MRFPRELALAAALALASSAGAAPKSKQQAEQTPATGLAAENQALADRLQQAELLAGLTDVTGSGLVVLLRSSPRNLKGVDRATLEIRDQDINAVLDALRIGGAEALAISDGDGKHVERILVLSAARERDGGIVVNGTPLEAPYRIFAVGDASGMRTELLRQGGVVKNAALDTLQMIELQTVASIRIPASRVPIQFKYARAQSGLLASAPSARTEPSPAPAPQKVKASAPVVVASAAPVPTGKAAPPAPARSKPAVTPPPASGDAPVTAPAVFGGKDLAKYHVTGCRFGERIDKSRRVTFTSPDAANKAGRAPCKICLKQLSGR